MVSDHRTGPQGLPSPRLASDCGIGRPGLRAGRTHVRVRVWVRVLGQGVGPRVEGQRGTEQVWASRSAEAPPVQTSVDPLHPLVVGVEGGLEVSPGRAGLPHPLHSVLPTFHKVQRDLMQERRGWGSLVTCWVRGSHPPEANASLCQGSPSGPRGRPEQVRPPVGLDHVRPSRATVWQPVWFLPRDTAHLLPQRPRSPGNLGNRRQPGVPGPWAHWPRSGVLFSAQRRHPGPGRGQGIWATL